MMQERRGMLLVDGVLLAGRVAFDATGIQSIEPASDLTADETDWIIGPGLIDLHVHGFGGADPLENLPAMSLALARVGTTAFQPTLFPAAPQVLGLQAQGLDGERAVMRAGEGARILGTHLEGPFVNPVEAGALMPEDLAVPSVQALREIVGPATGDGRGVGTMTIAPELPGALELIEECGRMGVRVSLGHSRAEASDAISGFEHGAVGVTHLFNASGGFHHRRSGLVGEALLRGGVFAEIIGDLVHVGERAVQLALAARGPQNLCLVSDALQGGGTGCEVFHSHGRKHVVEQGAAFYPAEKKRTENQLAGSASCQLEMVRRLVGRGVLSLEDAWTMGSLAPARALGLEGRLGRLKVGHQADLVVLNRRELALREVFVAGQSQLRAPR